MTIITVIDVTVTKQAARGKGKPYEVAEVVHTDDRNQGARTKKLVSFSNPQVFDLLKNAVKGDQFEITLQKEGDYWQWTSATPVEAGASPTAKVASEPKAAWVPDADRQRLIVKQSSLAQAVEFVMKSDQEHTVENILDVADDFVAWVFDAPQPEVSDDIPF